MQCDYLFLDISILVDQDRWGILLWIALDTHVTSDLAKFNISKPCCQFPPDFDEKLRFHIRAVTGC